MRDCFERHATKSIRQAELFSLHTKGFRGEAFASIAAIAHVEMKTKQDQEELGTQIIVEGSKFVSQEWRYCRKALHLRSKSFSIFQHVVILSDTVEYRHIIDEFQRVALAHPNIYFTFS
jgi:DNA mismatch repair protein MutL